MTGAEVRVVRVDLETGVCFPGGSHCQDYVFEELAREGFSLAGPAVVTPDGRYAVVTLSREVVS